MELGLDVRISSAYVESRLDREEDLLSGSFSVFSQSLGLNEFLYNF